MRRFLVFLMTFIIMFSLCNISFASAAAGEIQKKGAQIVSALIWCGYAVSVLMMVFIGIKYVLGSADSKANMKSAISGYMIGAAIVFSASTIMTIVVNLIPNSDTAAESAAEAIVNALDVGN